MGGPWPMAHGPWPKAHGPRSMLQKYIRFLVLLHELALERCYEALDRSEFKDFSFSIDLEGSQDRFIGLKGGLKGSKGPRSKIFKIFKIFDFIKISSGLVNSLSGAARPPGGRSQKKKKKKKKKILRFKTPA